MRKLSIFALLLLLISQTILGPIGVVSASSDALDVIESVEEVVTDNPTNLDENGTGDGITESEGSGEEEDIDNPEPVGEGGKDPTENLDDQQTEKSDEESAGNTEVLSSNYDPIMPVDMITKVLFTVNGTVVEGNEEVIVKNGDQVNFKFNVELPAGHNGGNYGEGTTLTYELPEIFEGLTASDNFGDVGTISIVGRSIIITFNENINDHGPIENGWFEVSANLKMDNQDWETTINLPGTDNIKLVFQPKGGTTVTKTGIPDNGGENSKYIDWKVIVNTNLDAKGSQSFVDELEGEHVFVTDPGKVIVKEIPIYPSGPGEIGNAIQVSPVFDNDNKKMTITLPEKEKTGYEITYQTEVGDPGNVSSANFKNMASYNGQTVSDNPSVNFGEPLTKSATEPGTDLVTEWTIKYNFNNRNISTENAVLFDTWTDDRGSKNGDGVHILEGGKDGVVVYDEDGTTRASIQYDVELNEKDGFTLKFKENVTKPYVIKYKTKPEGVYPVSSYTVTNTVKRIDMDETKSATARYSKSNLLLNKSARGVNYDKKEMNWRIVANEAGYSLKSGTLFEDVYGDSNQTLQEGSLSVKVNGNDTKYTLNKTLDSEGKEKGFVLILEEAVNGKIEIHYKTDYSIKDVGANERNYKNTVTLKESGLPGDPSASAEQSIRGEQKENGKKTGYYDYATKTFHWSVEFNFNLNELKNAVFEDILDSTQEIGSIKVEEGTINESGEFVPGATKTIENTSGSNHKIELKLGDINGPYKVTYTSKDQDGVFPHGSETVSITNKAKLSSDAGLNSEWTKTVEVKHTDKILVKGGKQSKKDSALINWNIKFNYAQSSLNNVVITDTVGKTDGEPDQLILEDSFKVYKVLLNGQTPDNPNEKMNLVDSGSYHLTVDVKNGTFTLELGNVTEAYYITYDTIFMGNSGADVHNDVDVTYSSSEGNSGSGSHVIKAFTYGSGASTTKVPIVIVKTDAETGEPMSGVEFTLYGPYTGDRELFKDKTDINGVLDFGIKFAEGVYILKETKVEGYENPDVEIDLDRNSIAQSGKYEGRQIVNIANVKENAKSCTEFTLTVIDVDGNSVANKTVTLINKATGQKHTVPTDENGLAILTSSDTENKINAGTYTVSTQEDGDLGEVKVQYAADCEAKVQPNPSCDNFTITLEDKNNVIRRDVTVTLKHEDGTSPEITVTTDANGKINLLSADTPTGVYKVYEGKQFLGTVKITYKGDCIETLVQAPACESFTLTVRDVDGNSRGAGVSITIKDKSGIEIAKGLITDEEGKVALKIDAGEYEVFEGDATESFAEFATNIDCEADVQPLPICKDFTVTVKTNENITYSNIVVTVKDKAGTEIITIKTDEKGQIKVPSKKLPAGKYTVYEGELFIGEITVSYLDGCQAEVKGNPTCTTFTLSIQDVNGVARVAGVKVTIKDAQGNLVTGPTGTEFTTVAGGIVPLDLLPKGTYTVYENGRVIGSFTVVNACSAIVKPYPSGGGWTPPTYPEDPTNPPSDNEKPTDPQEPNKPGDNPNKPGDKENPKDPDKEDPTGSDKPGKPVEENSPDDPNEEDPKEEKPTKPGTPEDKDDSSNGPAGNQTGNDSSGPAGSKPGSSTTDKGKADGAKGNGQNVKAAGKDTLPQTGEQHLLYMIILGFMLMIIGGFMIVRRKSVK